MEKYYKKKNGRYHNYPSSMRKIFYSYYRIPLKTIIFNIILFHANEVSR